jgi:hypothetical protein
VYQLEAPRVAAASTSVRKTQRPSGEGKMRPPLNQFLPSYGSARWRSTRRKDEGEQGDGAVVAGQSTNLARAAGVRLRRILTEMT